MGLKLLRMSPIDARASITENSHPRTTCTYLSECRMHTTQFFNYSNPKGSWERGEKNPQQQK